MTNLVQFPGLGLSFEINRVAFSIGNFNIYWYGILIGTGMLLALLWAFRIAPKIGINVDRMIDVIFIGALMAIVCARAYYVAMAPFSYSSIWEILDIRDGGFRGGVLVLRLRHIGLLTLAKQVPDALGHRPPTHQLAHMLVPQIKCVLDVLAGKRLPRRIAVPEQVPEQHAPVLFTG